MGDGTGNGKVEDANIFIRRYQEMSLSVGQLQLSGLRTNQQRQGCMEYTEDSGKRMQNMEV